MLLRDVLGERVVVGGGKYPKNFKEKIDFLLKKFANNIKNGGIPLHPMDASSNEDTSYNEDTSFSKVTSSNQDISSNGHFVHWTLRLLDEVSSLYECVSFDEVFIG